MTMEEVAALAPSCQKYCSSRLVLRAAYHSIVAAPRSLLVAKRRAATEKERREADGDDNDLACGSFS